MHPCEQQDRISRIEDKLERVACQGDIAHGTLGRLETNIDTIGGRVETINNTINSMWWKSALGQVSGIGFLMALLAYLIK